MSTTASTASEQSTGVTINNGVTGTIASFQSQPLNTTLLPGGIWSFYLHSYKQNNNASFNIFVEVYKITSGGTQTLLFTTDPASVTTNSPNPSMQLSDGYFSGTPLSVSDSIVAVVRATNTGNQSHIITLVSEGSQHYSYVVSTIPTQQGLTCDTLSGCSIIQTIQTDVSNKLDKSGGTITGNLIINSGLTANTISATTISLPFSSGSTLFAGTSGQISQNNSQFFWDNVNNRFGVGTNTPVAKLDVIGTSRISGTTSIVGSIIQTNSSFTGTHTIGFFANNAVRFTNSGIGDYMTAGPSNVVDFLGQNLQSVQRGATFGNTIASTGIVSITAMAAQSSGVINSSAIQFTHAINNTGTYSGITRGIYYNPTLTSLVGTTHRAIETVTGDVVLGSTSGSVLIGKTTNDGFKLDVSGTTRLSALTQNILTVIGSGNSTTSPIFSVQGSQGELFSVTDSLTGSLFSVNDISGLPILEVFSDNTTLMGNYLAPSLNTTARITLTAGTNTIYSIPVSGYTGAFFDYTVASTGTTGVRAGTIMSVWSGSTAEFTETSTNDIGITSGVTFSVISNGTLAQLRSSATTTGWIVKTIIRGI